MRNGCTQGCRGALLDDNGESIDVEVLCRSLTGKREAVVGIARTLRLALSACHLFVYRFEMDVLTSRLYQSAAFISCWTNLKLE